MKLFESPKFLSPPLVANSIRCPLCGSHEVEYEFVVDHLAYSRCRECWLLFANPSRREGPPARVDHDFAGLLAGVRVAARTMRSDSSAQICVSDAPVSSIGNVESVTVEAFMNSERTFDLVILLSALERTGDPYALLDAVRTKLNANGRVAIAFPSQASKEAIAQREAWAPFRERVRFLFSVDTVQAAATRAGFTEFLTFTTWQDLPLADQSAAQRWFASNALVVAAPAVSPPNRMLSVIFPCYNERATVRESLERVLQKNIPGIEMEVIIVENGSTDGTREIIDTYAHHPKVRIIHEPAARGKGYAVRVGLTHAKGEVVLFQDADLEYDVDDYDALVTPLFELKRNFVLGSRHNSRGDAWKIRRFDDQPFTAGIVNLAHLGLLALFNATYHQSLLDPFTMYKVFRRDCLYGLTFEDDRFDFDHEINIKLIRKGYQPIELPVNYQSRSFKEGKKVAFFRDPPTWVRAILRHRVTPLYPALADELPS